MKIKTRPLSWEQLKKMPPLPPIKPKKPWFLLQLLIRILAIPDLIATRFSFTRTRMENVGDGPYLILMNHSSFLDLKIASRILFPLKYNIVSTTDTFIGKKWLMERIGCIPTQKFVTDVSLVMNMMRIIKKEKRSVLMYPEAGYSFDGTTTRLPRGLGGLFKRLGVPVLMIRTDAGGFLRDPLYNGLRLRKVKVRADISCMLTPEEIREKSVEELDAVLDEAFSFDHFRQQLEEKIEIAEPFRATGLERVLYRCPACGKEGSMRGEGISFRCEACGKTYEMGRFGTLRALTGKTEFSHIPDWYRWQRECVRSELEEGTYLLDTPVDIAVICDQKALYKMGEGRLVHDRTGFHLTSADGNFSYHQDPYSSYSLNSDFFWYEIGDVIGIGNKERLYYCFPKTKVSVTRARLAAEEMYLMPKPAKENQ